MPKTSSQTTTAVISPSAISDKNLLAAAKGSGITFAGTIFYYVTRFVMGFVLARFLGSEQYGLYSLAITAAIVMSGLALLGLRAALVRYIALFNSQQDSARVWGVLQVGIGLPLISSILLAAGLYIGADLIAERLFSEPRLIPLLRLTSVLVPFLTLIDIVGTATQGFGKMQYMAFSKNVALPLLKLILVLMLAIGGLTVVEAIQAQIPAAFIVSGLLLYFLHTLFSFKRPLGSARRETKEMFKFSLPLYLSGLIHTFRGNIQTVLLGALNTITNVGVFIVANQINQLGQMFHRSVVDSSAPIISKLYGQKEWESLARIYQTMTKWTFTMNLPLFLTVLLFPGPLLSIFGDSFVNGKSALVILAWGNLLVAGTGVCGILLDMSGKTVFNMINTIILTILTISLNVLFIPQWGLIGAAIATLSSVATVNLLRLLEVYFLYKLLPYNVSFLKPVTAGLGALSATWIISRVLQPDMNLFYTAINIFVLFAVYVAIIFLLGLSNEDRLVLARVTGRINRIFSR